MMTMSWRSSLAALLLLTGCGMHTTVPYNITASYPGSGLVTFTCVYSLMEICESAVDEVAPVYEQARLVCVDMGFSRAVRTEKPTFRIDNDGYGGQVKVTFNCVGRR